MNVSTARNLMILMAAPLLTAYSQDQMKPLQPGATAAFELDSNQSTYYKMELPAGDIRVVVDVRKQNGRSQDLFESAMSVVDADGVPVKELGYQFTDVDVARREVGYYRLKRPATLGFRIRNGRHEARYWLTVTKIDAPFVPFEGALTPPELTTTEQKAGELEENSSAYYRVWLPKGNYRVIADLGNTRQEPKVLQGRVELLSGDGGAKQKLFDFAAQDVSRREAANITVKRDSYYVLRLLNGPGGDSKYTIRVAPEAN